MSSHASLWETAPATAAIHERPVHELFEHRRKMDEWSEIIRVIKDLLPDPEVSDADRSSLRFELAAAQCGAIACANAITACEERIRAQAARLRGAHGYLL
jgi:hypothetical protein